MLTVLIRKQLLECFRGYFVSQKTGKARTRGRIILSFIFFGVLMLILCGFSFAMATGILLGMKSMPDLSWLFHTLIGTAAILLGVFGSVFNTYASLYLPKDNEFLLSMPIRPVDILMSRLSVVYALSLLYSGVVWLPAQIACWIFGPCSALTVVFGLVLLFVLPLFVSVVTCALGWVIALIAGRLRSKSILAVLLGVAFFIVYYYVCFNMGNLMEQLIANLQSFGLGMKQYGGPLYLLGMAGDGSVKEMLIFCGITAVLTAACILLLARTYRSMLLRKPGAARAKAKADRSKVHSPRAALLIRELRRFVSSATYMMNAGFGIIFMILAIPAAIIYLPGALNAFRLSMTAMAVTVPEIRQLADLFLPCVAPLLIALITSMNAISLPAVSLEGKHLWIVQTMPVSGWHMLRAKRDMHILLNMIPSLVLCVELELLIGAPVLPAVASVLFTAVFIWFSADFGLMLGVQHPRLNWTNETVAIKQNMWTLVPWLAGLATLFALGAGLWFLRDLLQPWILMAAAAVLFALVTLPIEKWLGGKGAAAFQTL